MFITAGYLLSISIFVGSTFRLVTVTEKLVLTPFFEIPIIFTVPIELPVIVPFSSTETISSSLLIQ